MEEQACLVRTRSDSENSSKLGSFGSIRAMTYTEDRLATEGSGEPGNTAAAAANPPDNNQDGNESGELLDYNDSSVLDQFHEDAIRQAGCGLSQVRVLAGAGLAACGASLELAAIPFILPSAEIELCILPHQKNWLVMISLVGGSLGSVGWGVLAERLGRRRTLLSCLAVNAVFAAIAAFMPTYGTFMMARFCSSIGSGGIVPVSVTYLCECVPRGRRGGRGCVGGAGGAGAAVGGLGLGLGAGLLLAATLAGAVLPPDGPATLQENKEHFSAWHRYLLLCTLPILASLVSLIWTQESPRYLLDVGREVDAMVVYQNIHSGNQVRVCGGTSPAVTEYRLGELALPGKRPPPALHHVRHSVKMFWQSFFQLFSSTYRHTTLSLGGILLFSMAIQFYLSAYIPATVVRMESDKYEAAKKTVENRSFSDELYNTTLENIQYTNVSFYNCTFRDMLMSHVAFKNCSFSNVALSNIKTSYTTFEGTFFINSTIIDTDIEVGRELDARCVDAATATAIRGVRGGCARAADLAPRLAGARVEQLYVAHSALLAAVLAFLPPRFRPNVALCGGLVLLSPSLYFAESETALYIVEAVYRLFVTLIFFNVCLSIVDTYPANLRCTAHGLILCVTYMGGCAGRGAGAGGAGALASCAVSLALAAPAAALAALAATRRHNG